MSLTGAGELSVGVRRVASPTGERRARGSIGDAQQSRNRGRSRERAVMVGRETSYIISYTLRTLRPPPKLRALLGLFRGASGSRYRQHESSTLYPWPGGARTRVHMRAHVRPFSLSNAPSRESPFPFNLPKLSSIRPPRRSSWANFILRKITVINYYTTVITVVGRNRSSMDERLFV